MEVFRKTVTQWRLEGRRVPAKTPGASAVKVTPARYYGRVNGKQVPLSPDKEASRRMLRGLRARADLADAGLTDPYEQHKARPLADHLDDYHRAMLAAGNVPEHADLVLVRVRSILEGCRFKRIADFSPSHVVEYLASLRAAGRSIQTTNHYTAGLKAFGNWLCKDRRMAENPFRFLAKGNAETDRRLVRRCLDEEEFRFLVEHAAAGPTRLGFPGKDRAVLYLTAAYTGLRASELASLTPESIDAEAGVLTVAAAYSKHRREDQIPLHDGLAAVLRAWRSEIPAGRRLWPGRWAENKSAGKMLKADMAAARSAWIGQAQDAADRKRRSESSFLAAVDNSGRVVDFHGLRVQFITNLIKAGTNPKEAQALARHSSFALTFDRYCKIGLSNSAAAVQSLPALPLAETIPAAVRDIQALSEVPALRATGTDGPVSRLFPATGFPAVQFGAVPYSGPGDGERCEDGESEGREVLRFPRKSGDSLGDPASGGSGIRTHERLSTSPVFKTGAGPDPTQGKQGPNGGTAPGFPPVSLNRPEKPLGKAGTKAFMDAIAAEVKRVFPELTDRAKLAALILGGVEAKDGAK